MVDKSTNRISHSSRGHCSVSQRPVPCHVGLSYLFTRSELSGLMGAYPCAPDKSRTLSRPLHQIEPFVYLSYVYSLRCSHRLLIASHRLALRALAFVHFHRRRKSRHSFTLRNRFLIHLDTTTHDATCGDSLLFHFAHAHKTFESTLAVDRRAFSRCMVSNGIVSTLSEARIARKTTRPLICIALT